MKEDVGAIRGSTSARQIRRVRAKRLIRRIAIWVVLPTLMSIVYYGFWAAPQFESTAVLTVQSNKGGSPTLDSLAALMPAGAATPRDAMLVREYSLSRTMLDHLVTEHEFKGHYETAKADYWSRLDPDASTEDLYEYYRDKVTMEYSPEAGTLTLKVKAFTADAAQRFASAVLKAAEDMVNEMSERARSDRMAFAQEQVDTAEKRLGAARQALVELQSSGHVLNPEANAEAVLKVRTELEAELARLKSELAAASAVMTKNAPKVVDLRQRVRALQSQIKQQSKRLVSDKGESINETLAEFEPAIFEKEISQQAYETALRSLEIARTEALREQRYVETISAPSLPSEDTHPRRLWGIMTVFVLSIVLMGVVTMLTAAVREHAKF